MCSWVSTLKGYGFKGTQAVDVRGSWEEGTKVKSCLWTGLPGLCQRPPTPPDTVYPWVSAADRWSWAVWTGLFPSSVFSVLTLKVSGFISLRKVEISLFPIKIRALFWNFILAVQELFCSCREQELLAGCGVWLLTVVASLVQSMGSGHAGFSVAVYGLSSCGSGP